jgi:hypothetical protein
MRKRLDFVVAVRRLKEFSVFDLCRRDRFYLEVGGLPAFIEAEAVALQQV